MSNKLENPYRNPEFKTPWVVTDERWEREDYWADFNAWLEWMQSQLPDDLADQFSELEGVLLANIYAAMSDACRVAAGVEPVHRDGPQITVVLAGPASVATHFTAIEGEVCIPPGSVDAP